MMIVSFAIPQSQPFRVIFVLPAFLLLLSQAGIRYPKLFLTLLVYIALTGNITYYTRARIQREQWRQAIQFIDQKNLLVVTKFSGKFAPFNWYHPDLPVLPAVPTYPAKPQEVSQKLIPITTHQSILLMDYLGDLSDPGRVTDQVLANMGFTPGPIHDFPGVGFIREFHK